MKIAIPTKNNQVDDHFGHCEYFTVVTLEDKKVIESQKVESGNTCGCKSNIANTLKEQGVSVLLAGQMGQGAISKINNAGISVIGGCKGEINDLVKDYLDGKVKDNLVICPPHDHEHGHQCNN